MATFENITIRFAVWRERRGIVRMVKRRGDYRLFLRVENLLKKYVSDNGGDFRPLLEQDLILALGRHDWIGERSHFTAPSKAADYPVMISLREVGDIKEMLPHDDGTDIPQAFNSLLIASWADFVLEHLIKRLGVSYFKIIREL